MLRKMKFLFILMAVLLLLAGCKLKEKIGESITEGIVDKALGDDADIDIDNGELTLKSEDGGEVTVDEKNGMVIENEDGSIIASGGDYDWPEGLAADYIPKFNGGKLTYILNSEDNCMLSIEETKEKDFDDYVEKVKDKGFTEDKTETTAEDLKIYSAKTTKGLYITVYYMDSEGRLDITIDSSAVE